MFRRFWSGLVMVLCCATPALAVHDDTNAAIENLKSRIEALEKERAGRAAAFGPLAEHLKLSGLIEVEGSWGKLEGEDPTGDLVLATALLSTEARINEQVGGHITLLYEEGEGGLDLDEGVIYLTCPRKLAGMAMAFTAGRFYLPFGRFDNYLISDPLTLELGETNDTAAQVSLAGPLARVSLGVFNGETDASGDDDVIDSVVAALDVTPLKSLSLGASWISDLAESDNGLVVDAGLYGDSVPGLSAYAALDLEPVHFGIEYLGALERFSPQVVAAAAAEPDPGDLTGRQPTAINLELALEVVEGGNLALRYEQAHDFQDNLKRYGVAGNYEVLEGVVLGLEYLRGESDAPESRSHLVTAQLAMEF